jgi:transposase
MDSHTHSGPAGRLEIVETGRRRRWTVEEKLRIVSESLSGPRLASSTARRHGISASLLFSWRRAFQAGLLVSGSADPGFVPARIVPDSWPSSLSDAGRMSGRMEIVVRGGRRVIVDAGVDSAALARVVGVLERS